MQYYLYFKMYLFKHVKEDILSSLLVDIVNVLHYYVMANIYFKFKF